MGLGLGGAKRLVNVVRDHITSRRRNSRHHHEVEMTNSHGESIGVIVDETTKVGEARRRTSWLAGQLGFDDTAQGKAALIVTEVATNLLKHGGGGELIVQGLDYEPQGEGLEIFALDSGRGISDLGQCLADGYSTAGSPGTGLGAINRLVDSLQIYSNPGAGDGSVGSSQSNATAKTPE